MTSAIFIDKDGTLVENVPHNVDPRKIRLIPGVAEGLKALARTNFSLFVVTNQPGLAHGYFTVAQFETMMSSIEKTFSDNQCRLSGVYVCPHDKNGRSPRFSRICDCQKPKPGLLHRAAEDHQLDLTQSWMIGDILNDVEAGRRAGCRTILIDRGNETEWKWSPWRRPDYVAQRFDDAVDLIFWEEARKAKYASVG
jgi:D-glycero-D-manno-heptose 1,7-bisphosphate phosphatase